MRFRGFTKSLALAALVMGAPAQASLSNSGGSAANLEAERLAIARFQSHDQRLQDVGWKLARGNAEFCDNAIPSIGLQLQDMASYGSPQVAREALGLEGDFAVQTVAAGSPAARVNGLDQNREIIRIEGTNPGEWDAGRRFEWQRLARAHDLIDAELSENGSVTVTFADASSVSVEPVKACLSRFELLGQSEKAVADGKRVVIGIDFPAFRYSEAEFAAVVAHELAHNLLGHTAWLDRNGRSRGNTRMAESEADRLMPWLLHNAGYDPEAAARFLKEFRPYSGSLLFIRGSHPRWQERVVAVEQEIAQIEALESNSAKADWRTHFRREIDPGKGL